jgi:dienelactone hydrolase
MSRAAMAWRAPVVGLLLALGAFAMVARGRAQGQASTGPREASSDRRFGPLKTLNGEFPFEPSPTPEAWETRSAVLKRQIRVAVGLWPEPDRGPLRAVIHGKVARDGYTIERVFFQSLPGHFVTGSLYRPVGKTGKLPAVLSPHGHWPGGRFNEATTEEIRRALVTGAERFAIGGRHPLQARSVQLARMGVVVFLFDMVGYGDSVQIPMDVAHGARRDRALTAADGGLFFSPQAELRLQSIMGLQAWNATRAFDFLTSLPDVDPARIGVTGASGGATQTLILNAIDERPAVLFPAVMVSTGMQGGCTCENANYLRIGAGNVEIAALAAPRPLGMTTADDWTKTMPQSGFPALQRHYAMLDAPDRVALFPFPQFPHNFNYVSRAAMYGWMNRFLRLNQPDPIVEEDFVPLTKAEATVWDDAHPTPPSGEAAERTVTRWWTDQSERQMTALRPHDAQGLVRYRTIVGGALAAIGGREVPVVADVDAVVTSREHQGNIDIRRGSLRQTRWGEITPFVEAAPDRPNGNVVVWIDERGKEAIFDASGAPRPAIAALLTSGDTVLSVDVFLQGEFLKVPNAASKNRLVDGPPVAAFTYGYNAPLFIQRVHDVIAALRYARTRSHAEVRLVGLGRSAGPWAAVARGIAPSLVDRAAIDTGGFRFESVATLDDPAFIPGGAKYDDLPGALAVAAPGPLWLSGEGRRLPAVIDAAYRAAGAPSAVTLGRAIGERREREAVRWLVTGRTTTS